MQNTNPNNLSSGDRSKISDFLDSHPVGVLATVDKNNHPNASAIYFSVDNNLRVTFTTKRDTHKAQNIAHNNRVVLVTYDSENQSVVQVSGMAEVITDIEEAQKIYQGTVQAAKQTGEDIVPPVAKLAAGPYLAYEIKVDDVVMHEYGWGSSFEQAIEHAEEPRTNDDPA